MLSASEIDIERVKKILLTKNLTITVPPLSLSEIFEYSYDFNIKLYKSFEDDCLIILSVLLRYNNLVEEKFFHISYDEYISNTRIVIIEKNKH